ncbi:MAG: sarcosine oxidase subunit gamma family protein [Pseudomonadota bacterium]
MAKAASKTNTKPAVATFAGPLDGKRMARDSVSLELAAPCSRTALRADNKSLAAVSKVVGVALPKKANQSASTESRHALWLGPDEWLILDFASSDNPIVPEPDDSKYSAVDVTHRNVAINVEGASAEAVLAAGCPRDLRVAAFPVGSCCRTVFGKAEIILWRRDETTFHVECWRSYANYVWGFLADAANDAG